MAELPRHPGCHRDRPPQSVLQDTGVYNLVPDTNHVVVTTVTVRIPTPVIVVDNDYLTDARTPDGSLVVVYTPSSGRSRWICRSWAGRLSAQWFDPAGGIYYPVSARLSPTAARTTSRRPPTTGWRRRLVLVMETVRLLLPIAERVRARLANERGRSTAEGTEDWRHWGFSGHKH